MFAADYPRSTVESQWMASEFETRQADSINLTWYY